MGADDYDTTKFNSVLEAFNAATTRVTYQGRLPGSILVVAPDAAPGIGRSSSTLVEWPVQYTAARNRHDQGYGQKNAASLAERSPRVASSHCRNLACPGRDSNPQDPRVGGF